MKLRDTLENPYQWTEKDKKEYGALRKHELSPFYATEKISKYNPTLRATHLKRILNLTDSGKSEILEIMKKEGKAKALVRMEEIILDEY